MKHLLPDSMPKIYVWVFKHIFSLNGFCLQNPYFLKCPTPNITLFRTTRCGAGDIAQGTSQTALYKNAFLVYPERFSEGDTCEMCNQLPLRTFSDCCDCRVASFMGRKPWPWHSLVEMNWFIHALSLQ